MPMNRICSQRGFAISPTHNEQKWLFKRQMDAEKYAFQQVWGTLFVKAAENLQVQATFPSFLSADTI